MSSTGINSIPNFGQITTLVGDDGNDGSLSLNLILQPTMPNGTLCQGTPTDSEASNAVALYNQLPQGPFTADQLLVVGPISTALTYVLGTPDQEYKLQFYANSDGKVCTDSGLFPKVCITASYQACDGLMHVIDQFLVPPDGDGPDRAETVQTMYDISIAELVVPEVIDSEKSTETCTMTLKEAISAIPELSLTAATLNTLTNEDLNALFNSNDLAITYLASTDAALLDVALSSNLGENIILLIFEVQVLILYYYYLFILTFNAPFNVGYRGLQQQWSPICCRLNLRHVYPCILHA